MTSLTEIHGTSIQLCSNCGLTFQTRVQKSVTVAALSRLRENYVPVGAEEAALHDTISIAEADLWKCEVEISRLEHLCQELNAEKRRIKRIIDENRCLLAPIRRLPVELLSTIFELCLPRFIETLKSLFKTLKGTGILRTPFQIATTCRSWREIAMNLPSLWSRIVLDLDSTGVMTMDILNVFLDRSGEHSLHLFLKTTGEYPSSLTTCLIAANSFRVSHMKLLGNSDPFSSFTTSNLRFSRLTAFGFTCDLHEGEELDPFPWLVSATQLCFVALENVGRLSRFVDIMRNISFLATCDRSVSQTFHVLEAFPNIREGWIEVDELFGDEEMWQEGCMKFPDMQSLNIRRPGFEDDPTTSELDIGPCLMSLTVPSLSTIRLANDSVSWPFSWRLSDFASFLSRSGIGDKITAFDLRGPVGTSHQQITETLELLPAITDLVLYDPHPPGDILASAPLLARLRVDNNHRPLLPALVRLKIRFWHSAESNSFVDRLSLLVSLVKSRSSRMSQTMPSLQSVWFKLISPTGEESISDLAECRLLGVRVHAEVLTNNERGRWLHSVEETDWYDCH